MGPINRYFVPSPILETTHSPSPPDRELRALISNRLWRLQQGGCEGTSPVERVVSECFRLYREAKPLQDPQLKIDFTTFLKERLNRENATQLLSFALDNQIFELRDECLAFIKKQTNVDIACSDDPVSEIIFDIKRDNTDKDLEELSYYLSSLKKSMFLAEERIKISLYPSNTLNFQNFINENRLLITVLNLYFCNVDESTLQCLLKGTINLTSLTIKSYRINGDGIGLQELKQLKRLKIFEAFHCIQMTNPPCFKGCPHLEQVTFEFCSVLQRLPDFRHTPNLQKLHIGYCGKPENPPDLRHLPDLRILKLKACSAMKSFPEFSACSKLETVDLFKTPVIGSGPDFRGCSMLREVKMNLCPNITTGPNLTGCSNLRTLEMHDCKNVKSGPLIEGCINFRYLKIDNCPSISNDSSIALLQALIDIDPKLLSQPNLFKSLGVRNTDIFEPIIAEKNRALFLKNIGLFQRPVQAVRVAVLKALVKEDPIAALNYALELQIADSQLLKNLILSIDFMEEFRVSNSLPDSIGVHELIELYRALRSIDTNDFSGFEKALKNTSGFLLLIERKKNEFAVREFFIRNKESVARNQQANRLLQALYPPEYPENSVFYPIIINANDLVIEIICSLYAPLENSHEILDRLTLALSGYSKGQLPRRLTTRFIGEKGADIGGLTKQFLSDLFESLVSKKSPYFRYTGKGYLPVLPGLINNSSEYDIFYKIGKIFAFLLECGQKYPIGPAFDPEMFNLLLNIYKTDLLVSPNDYHAELWKLDLGACLAMCETFIEQDSFFEIARLVSNGPSYQALSHEARRFLSETLYVEEADFENFKTEILNVLRTKYLNTIAAIHAMARGIHSCLPIRTTINGAELMLSSWNDLRSIGGSSLSDHIQGQFGKEYIKSKIVIKSPSATKTDEIRRWINAWLERAEDDQIIQFSKFITGSPGFFGNITFKLSSLRGTFEGHTCSQTLEIPLDVEEEAFYGFLDHLDSLNESKRFRLL